MLTARQSKRISIYLVASIFISLFSGAVFADSSQVSVAGTFFEWGENSKYPFSSSSGGISTASADTYGDFSITGSFSDMDDLNGVPSYLVEPDTTVSFTYSYDDSMLTDNDNGDINWHITEDNHKKIDDDSLDLDGKIKSGAIVIQTSLDGANWITDEILLDIFESTPVQNDAIYFANDIQLLNGTYYRFIVVYRERKMVGSSGWAFFQSLQYDVRERAEIYTVYLESETSYTYQDNQSRQAIGSVVNAGSHNGFSSTNALTSNDFQYGWDLGNFFVSGYSDKVTNDNGDYVFLKNVGDRVALNFNLLQDINCLDGKDYLRINRDMDGTDAYFQTTSDIDFERGALMIRFIDHEGISHDQIYTNYLEANTRTGADTRVYLFEEGDYEVALDYEIVNTRGVNTYKNYRIFFRFSIRNGNCMVFPRDSVTGSELDNLSSTRNGFILDLAGSRWLHITVTRFVMNSNNTGLDQRYSRNDAQDMTPYDDDGIYVIEVTNDYAPGTTYQKIICVGTNSTLNNYFNNTVVPNPSILSI